MYASQLLRILQTFPTHVNNEICDFDTDELKEAMKESPRRYTNPFLSDEENEKVNFWNNQELEHSNIRDDFTNNLGDEKFTTEFYTDKNVMECELPELLVCYKEGAFHVKDICVDEGIPHGEKILFDEDDHEILRNSSPNNEAKHDDMVEDSLHSQFLKPEQLKFSPMEDCYTNPDLCSGTKENVNTDLPILEPTNYRRDMGDDRDEIIEGNLDIQPLKGERMKSSSGERMKSSSWEDCCTKSDASSGTEEVDNHLPIPGSTLDKNMGNIHVDREIPVQDGQNSIPVKDCEGDAVEECGTKKKIIDTVIPNEARNMSKDDIGDDDGPSKCAPYKLKFSVQSDTVPKGSDNCDPDISVHTGEEQINSSANLLDNSSTEQVLSNSVPSLQQDRPLPSLKVLLESYNNGARDVDQKLCQSPVDEMSKRPLVRYEVEELGRSLQTTNISNESRMEGNISLNFNNGEPAASSSLHGAENPECVHDGSLETQGAPNHQDLPSDNITMANQVQRGEGESSFSVAGPVSGLITYSGPIAFSGSVSLRSDSSTTSTRSFAFPILQTEWNSSPVRMAKADRRRLQKHRGWRLGLLCCRF